ncbi:MAG: hypothetical protein NT018_10075 [Armatimonadetes bacterium]|nr:hypothetical protein [Armatimonadota bacterium]
MKNNLLVLLVVVISMFAVSHALAVGKVTVDPNVVKKVVTPQPPVAAADARLDVKITYDASGVRLHQVIAEIARVTGATIYCGKSSEDWRARDIPVTVAARDIPARKLLKFVTYATQTSLVEVKTEKRKFYRVVRNAKLQKASDDYQAAVDNFEKAHAKWSLDAACRLKDIPPSDIKAPKDADLDWSDITATQIEISKLLSAMDADTRNSILSGDQLILTPRTAPAGLRPALLAFFRSADKLYVNRQNSGRMFLSSDSRMIEPATTDELQDARLGLNLEGRGIMMTGVVPASGPAGRLMMRISRDTTSSLADIVLANMDPSTLPKQPTYPSLPEMDQLSGAKGMWDSPEAAQKVTVKLEADGKPKFSGDALIALSKALNLTIVCEDFETVCRERDIAASFGKESTVQEALRVVGLSARWWVHGESKALIGVNSNWMQELRNLIPQRLIDGLTAKANGDGVDLDDATELAGFPEMAVLKWCSGETLQGLASQAPCQSRCKAIWSFYSSLSPWEKGLARSNAGLPLNRYDPKVIAGMLKDNIKKNLDSDALFHLGVFNSDEPAGGAASDWNRVLDPAVLPTLVMRLKTSEPWAPPNPSPSISKSSTDELRTERDKPIKIPAGFAKRLNYYILIEGGDARSKISLPIDGPNALPFFSPKRTKELSQALADQKAAAAQPVKN